MERDDRQKAHRQQARPIILISCSQHCHHNQNYFFTFIITTRQLLLKKADSRSQQVLFSVL